LGDTVGLSAVVENTCYNQLVVVDWLILCLKNQIPAKERQPGVAIFGENFSNRFSVVLQEFRLKLQANIGDETGPEIHDNVSVFTSLL